jgi:copper transport protein
MIEPPAELAQGSYVLSWRVTSADGHPIGGSVVFSVGRLSPAAPVTATGSETLWPFIWAARVALYIGLFLGVGALAFHAFIAPAPPRARRVSMAAIALGLAALGPSALLQGLDLMGLSFDGLTEPNVWSTALSSTYMRILVLGAFALAVGVVAWLLPSGRLLRILSVAAVAAVGAALSASGHASAAEPQWLTRPAVFLHGVCIAIWAGSLVPFALVLRAGGDTTRLMVARFSRAIFPIVGVLTIAGIALAVVQVEHTAALWTTAYGRVFLAKLGLLLLLFTLAAINRFILTPAYQHRKRGAVSDFTRSVRMEVVLVCAILAVAALWRFTPPPRSLALVAAAPVSIHMHTDKAMVELTITPGRAGRVTASLQVMDGTSGR